jgi:hypothetical protein
MPRRQQHRVSTPGPYRSLACHIGTHGQCDETEPKAAPLALPVVYETCVCQCHRSSVQGCNSGSVR